MKVLQSRFFTACVASLVTAMVVGGIAWAQIPATNGVITGCYDNKTGALRVIDASKTKCAGGTTELQWNQKGAQGVPGPPGIGGTCSGLPHVGVDWSVPASTPGHGCDFMGAEISGNISNANLTNANLTDANFSCACDYKNINFTGVEADHISLQGAVGAIWTNATLTNANLACGDWTGDVFVNANLSGSDLSSYCGFGGTFKNANFTRANLTGADFAFSGTSDTFTNASFTNANATKANFKGATGMGSATLNGVIWSDTICPDGTNSNSDGNTCVGHL